MSERGALLEGPAGLATSWFAARDGRLLSYRSQGSGPVVVMVPGGPTLDPSAYFALADLPGRRQVFLTPRATRDPTTHSFGAHVDDLEDLRRHLGVDRMGLYGGGLGVTVALAYTRSHPDVVEQLVLVNGPARFDLAYQSQLLAAQRRFAATTPLGARRLECAADAEESLDLADCRACRRQAQSHLFDAHVAQPTRATETFLALLAASPAGVEAAAAAYDELVGGLDLLDGCAWLTTPTLVMAGELDATVPAEHMRLIADSLPRSTFALVPDVGHFPELEAPTLWRRHVESFLGA